MTDLRVHPPRAFPETSRKKRQQLRLKERRLDEGLPSVGDLHFQKSYGKIILDKHVLTLAATK